MWFFKSFLSCALCALCAVCGGQRSALFSAVQLAGRTQCSPDPPLVTLTAKSRLDCSERCAALGDGSCVAFNFKQVPLSCELFDNFVSHYTEVPGCTLYQRQEEEYPGETFNCQRHAANFSITADNTLAALYFNDIQVPNSSLPNAALCDLVDTVMMLNPTRVIAFHAVNAGGPAGVLASSSDGRIVTNSAWRCTNSTPPSKWTTVHFDDSQWPHAVAGQLNYNTGGPKYEMYYGNIQQFAFWIWTNDAMTNYNGWDAQVFCRLKLLA